jgi:hypothetical protein
MMEHTRTIKDMLKTIVQIRAKKELSSNPHMGSFLSAKLKTKPYFKFKGIHNASTNCQIFHQVESSFNLFFHYSLHKIYLLKSALFSQHDISVKVYTLQSDTIESQNKRQFWSFHHAIYS